MATSSEYVQSVLAALVLVQNSEMSESTMEQNGVLDILTEMDSIASELVEVLE